jgi:hypothetical protein
MTTVTGPFLYSRQQSAESAKVTIQEVNDRHFARLRMLKAGDCTSKWQILEVGRLVVRRRGAPLL